MDSFTAGAQPVAQQRAGSLLVALALLVLPLAVQADWRDNSRFAFDVSARIAHEDRADNQDGFLFTGIDGHKVFSSASGDVATLLVQVYAATLNDVEGHPPIFSDEDDTEITYRNLYLNFTGLTGGILNFKIGHFEVPFGVEQVINTNGTLRDYQHGPNLGVKADWGASLNGQLQTFEYEFAWQRGSGNEWETRGDPGFYVGRIGTPRSRQLAAGISFMRGDIYRYASPDTPLERERYALDLIYGWRRFEARGEFSWGKDFDDDVRNVLVELETASMNTSWLYYTQFRAAEIDRVQGSDRAASMSFGIKYEPDNRVALSAEITHDFHTFATRGQRNLLRAQARYRF